MSAPQPQKDPTREPGGFLVACNAVSAGLGCAIGLFVARVLGPEQLGVTAVIAGINGSIAAFLDVRLNDLAAKAFYQTAESSDARAHQAGVIWTAVCTTSALALVAILLSIVIGNRLIPLFTPATVARWWLPANALVLGMNLVAGCAKYLLRFTRHYTQIGVLTVAVSVTSALVTVAVLLGAPSLNGYYMAALVGSAAALVATCAVSWRAWTAACLPMCSPSWQSAAAVFRANARMLFYGNLLGYAKLLQRSADTLLVARFTDDRETGLYKLTRTIVDNGLAVLQEAFNQVYFPSLLEMLARKMADGFRRLARRLLFSSLRITAALVAAELLILPWAVPIVLGEGYRGVHWPIAVFTVEFIFITGCYPWLWAITIHSGRLRGFTAAAVCSVGVQYAVAVFLFTVLRPSALSGVVAALSYYFFLIPAVYLLARRAEPDSLPGGLLAVRRKQRWSERH